MNFVKLKFKKKVHQTNARHIIFMSMTMFLNMHLTVILLKITPIQHKITKQNY